MCGRQNVANVVIDDTHNQVAMISLAASGKTNRETNHHPNHMKTLISQNVCFTANQYHCQNHITQVTGITNTHWNVFEDTKTHFATK